MRTLKASGTASKEVLDVEIEKLLQLKAKLGLDVAKKQKKK